jgi:hypothetical protein
MDELVKAYEALEAGNFALTEAQEQTVRERVPKKLLTEASVDNQKFWRSLEEARQALAPGEQFMQVRPGSERRDVRYGTPVEIGPRLRLEALMREFQLEHGPAPSDAVFERVIAEHPELKRELIEAGDDLPWAEIVHTGRPTKGK